jgi:hypothetical protein
MSQDIHHFPVGRREIAAFGQKLTYIPFLTYKLYSSVMTHPTIDGFDLRSIFRSATDEQNCAIVISDPRLASQAVGM